MSQQGFECLLLPLQMGNMDDQEGDYEEEEEEDDELKAHHDDFGSRQGEFDDNHGLQGGGCATFSLRPALHLLGSLDWEHLLSSASA